VATPAPPTAVLYLATPPNVSRFFLPIRLVTALAFLLALMLPGVRAQDALRPTTTGAAPSSRQEADVMIFNRTVATFRSPLLGVSAEDRAQRTRRSLDALLERGGKGEVTVRQEQLGRLLLIDGTLALILTEGDTDSVKGETLDDITAETVVRLSRVIEETRESRDTDSLLHSVAQVGLTTAIYLAFIWTLRRLRRLVAGPLLHFIHGHSSKLKFAGAELVRRDRLRTGARFGLTSVFWLLIGITTYQWLSWALRAFPFTRVWGEQLQVYLLGTVANIVHGILGSIPNLATALFILLLARGAVAMLRPVFEQIERGHTTSSWLDQDTVGPTRRIANALIWAFALVMAYPYLPGAHTDAFKGMSVLIGLMISLGATSVVGQAASGIILMYSRVIRRGEYVRIGEIEGTITDLGLFTTRLRNGLGEEINMPNSLILGSATKNYSRAIKGTGYVVDTTVSIGYDTPWRQVEAMLLQAAQRTDGVLADPPPQVFQTELADYYPVYRLVCQALPSVPRARAEVLTHLHANIQDVFNSHGVQIMSPHYMADTPEAKTVPRVRWYAAPAKPPGGAAPGSPETPNAPPGP